MRAPRRRLRPPDRDRRRRRRDEGDSGEDDHHPRRADLPREIVGVFEEVRTRVGLVRERERGDGGGGRGDLDLVRPSGDATRGGARLFGE